MLLYDAMYIYIYIYIFTFFVYQNLICLVISHARYITYYGYSVYIYICTYIYIYIYVYSTCVYCNLIPLYKMYQAGLLYRRHFRSVFIVSKCDAKLVFSCMIPIRR